MLPMLDAALMTMGPFVQQQLMTGGVERPEGNLAFSGSPFSGAFSTAHGLLMVTANTLEQAGRLCALLECPEVMDDPRIARWSSHPELVAELRPVLEKAYAARSAEDWEQALGTISVPAGKVRALGETLAHPQVVARAFLEEASGDGELEGLQVPGVGFRARVGPGVQPNAPPPRLGQHTREVLSELGLQSDAIQALVDNGVVAG